MGILVIYIHFVIDKHYSSTAEIQAQTILNYIAIKNNITIEISPYSLNNFNKYTN